jgi:ubiquitin-protein ligase
VNPRLRRLETDQKRVMEAFADNLHVRLVKYEGSPANRYIFSFRVAGLVPRGDSLVAMHEHSAEVFLPLDYPRCAPFCRMLSPVFHPNIDPQKICIGDHWSAGQSLVELVVRIAEMICFQSYNTKSPLNAKAAAWAEQNFASLPLEKSDLATYL